MPISADFFGNGFSLMSGVVFFDLCEFKTKTLRMTFMELNVLLRLPEIDFFVVDFGNVAVICTVQFRDPCNASGVVLRCERCSLSWKMSNRVQNVSGKYVLSGMAPGPRKQKRYSGPRRPLRPMSMQSRAGINLIGALLSF